MKNFLHKTALAGLMVLYAFLVSFHTGDGSVQDNGLTKQQGSPKQENYRPVIAKSLVAHTNTTENSLSVTNVGDPSSFKYHHSDITAYCRYFTMLVTNRLLLHQYFFKHAGISLPTTGIIFPFHYFW